MVEYLHQIKYKIIVQKIYNITQEILKVEEYV